MSCLGLNRQCVEFDIQHETIIEKMFDNVAVHDVKYAHVELLLAVHH